MCEKIVMSWESSSNGNKLDSVEAESVSIELADITY